MPYTSATCSMASLSISGVPPFNGFWSKLIIVLATVRAAQEPWLGKWAYFFAAVTVVVSVLTLVSFVKVQKYIIFGPASARVLASREVVAPMAAALVVLAALCLGLGLFAPAAIGGLIEPAQQVLTRSGSYLQYVLGR
jgi:multicomponent Na+:H+ antiporter subunit D